MGLSTDFVSKSFAHIGSVCNICTGPKGWKIQESSRRQKDTGAMRETELGLAEAVFLGPAGNFCRIRRADFAHEICFVGLDGIF